MKACEACRHSDATVDKNGKEILICRRNPPQIGKMATVWPRVTADDWCAEWASK